MWHKPYGKTGKQVSVISFGGMRFDHPEDIDGNAEIVLHAYRKGVNYFDTAPFYCSDRSEEIIGAAVKRMKPGTFYVSTKCMEEDGAALRASLERSLKRLNVSTIDFFHIWCLVTPDQWPRRVSGGAVKAALQARDEGLIEHLAVSSHLQGADLRAILEEGLFEGVTLGYSAINFPYRQEAIDTAGRLGLGVMTMNPLAGGVIPQNAERLDFLREPADRSVVESAIRFNISQPAVTSALVGFTTKAHIDQAVTAVEGFRPYGPDHVETVRAKVKAEFADLCTGCGYCLPCPEGIDIPRMMDSYNMKLLLGGKDEEIVNRLGMHWGTTPEAAKACSLCGACEDKCTQHLPIRERMTAIAKLAGKK